MTRKDYQAIAAVLRNAAAEQKQVYMVADILGIAFPGNFNRDKFVVAALTGLERIKS